jgi:hypothetical protein
VNESARERKEVGKLLSIDSRKSVSRKTERAVRIPASSKPVDLGSENEIAFGEPIDLVRPDRDPDLAPRERDIRVMALVFGKLSDLIHEAQGRLEIRESQLPFQMVVINDLPLGNLRRKRPDLGCGQRRDATPAGNACLF